MYAEPPCSLSATDKCRAAHFFYHNNGKSHYTELVKTCMADKLNLFL